MAHTTRRASSLPLRLVGALVLLCSAGYTARVIWLKQTYTVTTARIENEHEEIREPGQASRASDQVKITHTDRQRRTWSETVPAKALWLGSVRGESVPVLVNPRDPFDYHFNSFAQTWGFSLILAGVGIMTLLIARRT